MRRPDYKKVFKDCENCDEMVSYAIELWEMYKDNLQSRGLFNSARAKMVDRLVRYQVEFDNLYPVAVADGPTKESQDGGQYVNMLWSQVKNLNKDITKLEKSLCLTPESVGSKEDVRPISFSKTMADEYLSRN